MTELSTITPEAIHITGMRVTFKDVNPGKQEARRGTKKPSEPEESAVAVLTGSVAGDMLLSLIHIFRTLPSESFAVPALTYGPSPTAWGRAWGAEPCSRN